MEPASTLILKELLVNQELIAGFVDGYLALPESPK